MSKVQGRLRIAVQKSGRLAERSLDLIRNAGLRVIKGNNDLLYKVENAPVDLLRVRDDDIPTFVADGVCDAATIDDVVKLGFGARMAVLGPLEQSDLVGLDLTLAIHESLIPTLDRTAGAHPYLVEKVERGELGMDAGVGFRTWTPSSAKAVRDRLDRWTTQTSQGRTT